MLTDNFESHSVDGSFCTGTLMTKNPEASIEFGVVSTSILSNTAMLLPSFPASILLLTSVVAASSKSLDGLFNDWKVLYKKEYKSVEDERRAFKNWQENKILVDSSNSKASSWRGSVGKFGDLSNEEFAARMLLRPTSSSSMAKSHKRRLARKSSSIPAAFDWRDSMTRVVTTVKDQGTVGSCWAFSTIGNIEGQWALAGHDLVDLSPEFLVDCDGTHDDLHADCSVFGGWPYLAYDFIIGAGGVPSEASYPYCSGTGDCYPCMLGPVSLCGPPPYSCDRSIPEACPSVVPTASIADWSSVSTNEDDIAEALYSYGPLSVLLDAAQLQYYQEGVWPGHIDSLSPLLGCHNETLSHAVLLVGYGQEEAGQKYWTVKNSWGEDWGEQGYFRIVRGEGLCGINTAVTTSIIV